MCIIVGSGKLRSTTGPRTVVKQEAGSLRERIGGDSKGRTAFLKYRTAAFRGPTLGILEMIEEARRAVGIATMAARSLERRQNKNSL
jgi:hypothetical protein